MIQIPINILLIFVIPPTTIVNGELQHINGNLLQIQNTNTKSFI